MSHWSIEERSDSRLVAKATPPRRRHPWTVRILKALVVATAFGPGVVALTNGAAILPTTLNCTANAKEVNVMDCRQKWTLGSIEVRHERFQLVNLPDKTLERSDPGDPRFFLFGLFWLVGTASSLVAIQLAAPKKTNWVFDRTTIQKKPETFIRRSPRTIASSDVYGLVLEIPDLNLDSQRTDIYVRLNLHEGETPTQYLLWNENQPAVYSGSHTELPEIITSVIQPICQILDRPWQLKFFHEDECFIFDFKEQAVDRYLNGDRLMHLEFSVIDGFEIEEPNIEPQESLLVLEPETLRYLNIVLDTGERFRIHQYANFLEVATAIAWLENLQQVLQKQVRGLVVA